MGLIFSQRPTLVEEIQNFDKSTLNHQTTIRRKDLTNDLTSILSKRFDEFYVNRL